MRRCVPRVAVFLLLALAGDVAAQERWELTGEDAARGPFTARLELRRVADGDLLAELRVEWLIDSAERLAGVVHLRSRTRLEARLAPAAGDGFARVFAPPGVGVAVSELALEETGPEAWRAVLRGPRGELVAEGRRVGVEPPNPPASRLGKRLLALAKEEVGQLLQRGVSADAGLDLGEHIHLGVVGRAELLDLHQLEPEQETALGRDPGRVWVETWLEGGIRFPFQGIVDLSGATGLRVGFEPGARLRYRVRELHPVPAGGEPRQVLAGLLKIARRSIDLPLTADEALALEPGAERVLEGEATLTWSGSLAFGADTEALGDGVLGLGAEARVGGFWRRSGPLRIGLLRQEGSRVRLRWSRGQRRESGAEARALLGLALLEPPAASGSLEFFRPERLAQGLLRFQLRAEVGRLEGDELDLAWALDLERPAAREAFDRALRGDLRGLDALAAVPGSGVEQELRVVEHEERTWRGGELAAFRVVELGTWRALSLKDLLIEDARGKDAALVVRVERRDRSAFLFGLARTEREARLELVRSRPQAGGAEARSLRYRLIVRDPRTGSGEVARLRGLAAAWALPGTSEGELPTPGRRFLQSRWGRTRMLLQVDLAESGVAALGSAGADQLRAAWLAARERVHPGPAPDREAEQRRRRIAARDARRFAEAVATLSGDREALARGLADLSRLGKNDLTLVAALLELAPRDAVRVRLEIDGKRIDYDGERRGQGFAPPRPLHGH